MSTSTGFTERYQSALMNTFGPPKLVLARGKGAHVWDEDGREYVDLLGGIAVNALGHAHPAIVEAVSTQLQTLGHISNFFASAPQIALAEKLLQLVGLDTPAPGGSGYSTSDRTAGRVASASERIETLGGRVFFANSGTEANEAAFKLTRRTGRRHLVAMSGSFHGRTMGSLALTSKEAYRAPFEPLPGDVTFVPYGDADALAAAVTDETAAIVVEPIQGEAGVVVAPEGFLAAARAIADDHGALLWFDEIQSGMGRTGRWLASHSSGVTPDIVTLAKGLGGGFPIGACVGLGRAATLLEPGNHGTTFGGNPVACAAGLAVIRTIESEGLLEHAVVLGQKLRDGLAADPHVAEVTGEGLLIGVVLTTDKAAEVTAAALRAGFIVNNATSNRVRLAPPLVLADDDAEAFLGAWPAIVAEAHS
ncbi:acetylornithine transaminase [Nocardioides sp. AN3]